MDWSAPHAGYVLAAYAVSAAVIIALAAFIVLTARARAREIETLERQGLGRRGKAP